MTVNEPQDTRGATILVVAEQDSFRDLLKDIFEAYGYSVRPCDGLREAAESLLQEPIALVVMELDRPASGQVDALRSLRRSSRKSKVVAVLGDPSLSALEPLVDAIVWKPFSVEQFVAIAAGLLGDAEGSKKLPIAAISQPR